MPSFLARAARPALSPSTLRLLGLGAAVALALALGKLAGLDEVATVEGLRAKIEAAGAWGIAAFLVAFALSNLLSLPAIAFILAALVAWGTGLGLPIAFAGGLLAASSSFWTVRWAKGRPNPSAEVKNRHLRRALDALGTHPVAVVAALRLLFVLSGPLNAALALSRIRYRHYLAGTALGLMPPLLFFAGTLRCWVD